MPHFTVMIGSDGPTIDLAVAVGRAWQRRLATRGTPVPSPTTVRALIDTGSDLSAVHPQVLQQLGVQAIGSVRIRRPGVGGGFRLAAMFDIQLSIGGVSPGTQARRGAGGLVPVLEALQEGPGPLPCTRLRAPAFARISHRRQEFSRSYGRPSGYSGH